MELRNYLRLLGSFLSDQEGQPHALAPIGEERNTKTLEERIIIGPSELLVIPSRARVRVADSGPCASLDGRHAAEVAVDEAALRIMHAHVLSNRSVEVAGVLLGPWPRLQENGRYRVHVIDAKHAHSNGARIQQWTYYSPNQLNQLWKIVQP